MSAVRRPVLTTAALLLAVAACQMPAGGTRSAQVLDGALTVGVPQGYCIDRGAGREAGDTAVVLMGRCREGSSAVPAVVTLSVGAAGTAAAMAAGGDALSGYFTSDAGRATLSRDGRAADVRVLEARQAGDAFVMRISDRAVGDYWRAVTGVNGRLVTVSVTGPGTAPLPPGDGRALLDRALAALARANPAA